jgi:DNA-binding protein H-NS
MSRGDLVKLKADVEKALVNLEQKHKSDAKKAMEDAAKKFGFSVEELVGKQKTTRSKSAAKYRNPADPKQTWSGRGRQPGWIKEGLAKGKKMSEFAI